MSLAFLYFLTYWFDDGFVPILSPPYCRHNVYIHFIRQCLRGHRSGSNPKVENIYVGRGRKGVGWIGRRRRMYRWTVKMLEFTEVYPPFFSLVPGPLRVLSISTSQPSCECPTRISPFYANRDSRIYQFICCTWSATNRPLECDAKNSLSSHTQQYREYGKKIQLLAVM